jgi:hypothetical protein
LRPASAASRCPAFLVGQEHAVRRRERRDGVEISPVKQEIVALVDKRHPDRLRRRGCRLAGIPVDDVETRTHGVKNAATVGAPRPLSFNGLRDPAARTACS